MGLIPGDLIGESLCGPWGCLPPAQALLSLHLLWLVVLAPPAFVMARHRPGRLTKRVGVLLTFTGLLAITAVVAGGLTDWGFSTSDPNYGPYAIRRALYALVTRTEIPAFQMFLTGLTVVIAARRQTRTDCPQ